MNKNEIKDKIKSSFSEETPDLFSRIMESCDKEDVAREELSEKITVGAGRKAPIYVKIASLVASFLVVFIIGAFVGKSISLGVTEEDCEDGYLASVFIDVNPSVSLTVNEENRVVDCVAGNEDAKAIISDMDLKGTNVKTALNAIIGSMYMNGYLADSTNSMLVSVDFDGGEFDGLLDNIVENVNDIVQKSGILCSIVAQDISDSDSESLKELAKENSVSHGKMSLINKIVDGIEDYSEKDVKDLASLGIKELNTLYAIMKEKESEKTESDSSAPGVEKPGDTAGESDKDENSKDESEVTPAPDEGENSHPEKPERGDIISGVLDFLYSDKDKALALAVNYLSDKLGISISESDASGIKVRADYVTVRDGKWFELVLVYKVSFRYDGENYEFTVDLEKETVADTHDKDHGYGHENEPDDPKPEDSKPESGGNHEGGFREEEREGEEHPDGQR